MDHILSFEKITETVSILNKECEEVKSLLLTGLKNTNNKSRKSYSK